VTPVSTNFPPKNILSSLNGNKVIIAKVAFDEAVE
jgi:hypothetical protein